MMTSFGWQRLRRCRAHCSATVTSRVTPRGPNTLNCLQRRSGLMSCVQRHFSVSGRPRRTSRVYFRESSSKGAEASSSILEKKLLAATNGAQPGPSLFGASLKCSPDWTSSSRGAQSEPAPPPPLCERGRRKRDAELQIT